MSKIRVDIYDTDGDLRETVGGRFDADELLDMLEDFVRNDGIPVVRMMEEGEHFAEELCRSSGDGDTEAKYLPPLPMMLEVRAGDFSFHAIGREQDVTEAFHVALDCFGKKK